jgi:hypothetical protein
VSTVTAAVIRNLWLVRAGQAGLAAKPRRHVPEGAVWVSAGARHRSGHDPTGLPSDPRRSRCGLPGTPQRACWRRGPGVARGASAITLSSGRGVDSAGKDVSGTHHRTDIMADLFSGPWKVLLVAVVLLAAAVLIALFGSKKLPGGG